MEWELLQKIVLYAEGVRPEGLALSFGGTTNGTLLTTEKFDFLDKHRIFFLLSLDGTAETHDKHRKRCDGTGSQAVIVENLKAVLRKWPFYRVRMSPYPERIDHFYEDCEYLIKLGVDYLYYSPVYEHDWKREHWDTWKDQCFKVVDLLGSLQRQGRTVRVEHFSSYINGSDGQQWPCGAGRQYVGIDTDGSIWPCHRFVKFEDERPWQEKEMCFGHIDHGITKPEVRDRFINFEAKSCAGKECLKNSPCHGGCYAANHDLEGDIEKACKKICEYVEMQREVSRYYKHTVNPPVDQRVDVQGGICKNMCYLQNTPNEIIGVDPRSTLTCHCDHAVYNGPAGPDVAIPLTPERREALLNRVVRPQDVLNELYAMKMQMGTLIHTVNHLASIITDRAA